MRIAGNVHVVTGAASGLGGALAAELVGRGGRVVAADVDRDGLAALGGRLGQDRVHGVVADVSDRGDVERVRAEALDRFGQVDVVVNNAGLAHDSVTVAALPVDVLDQILAVNLHGVVHGVQVFLPDLLARPAATIVNVSSVFGLVASGWQSAYSASKFAVRGLTESLRMELRTMAPHVTVTVVHPGGLRTSIARNNIPGGQRDEQERLEEAERFEATLRTEPNDAATWLADGIAEGRERILLGADARAIDALGRLSPLRAPSWMLRQQRTAGLVPDDTPGPSTAPSTSADGQEP